MNANLNDLGMKAFQKSICVHLRSFAAKALVAGMLIIATPAGAQVFGVRTFSGECAVDQPVDVLLDLEVGDQVPNGVIIVEKLPTGWTLDAATPPPSNLNTISGEVRWMFFGASVNDNLEIRYTTSGGNPATATITGDVRFNNPAGEPQSMAIGGDEMCMPVVRCTGDCNVDGTVSINEIVQLITAALEGGADCIEPDQVPGGVTVDLIVAAVSHALSGCP